MEAHTRFCTFTWWYVHNYPHNYPSKTKQENIWQIKTRKIISFIFSLVNKFSCLLLVFTTWGYRNVLLAKRSHTVLPDDSWSVSCALVRWFTLQRELPACNSISRGSNKAHHLSSTGNFSHVYMPHTDIQKYTYTWFKFKKKP